MARKPTIPVLRKIPILVYLPSFVLLLAAGIGFRTLAAALSIIPLSFSLLSSLFYLHRRRQSSSPKMTPALGLATLHPEDSDDDEANEKPVPRFLWAFTDLVLACMYLAALLPLWILESRKAGNAASSWGGTYKDPTAYFMVETYGSCGLIINMCIHAYLFFCAAVQFRFDRECPTCKAKRKERARPVMKKEGKGPKYSLLGDYREEAEAEGEENTRKSVEV
ncbi:hypothetical protein CC78DRAFT_619976 [Lojkania enalia]|uniref:Uncharacterized protein n=1 Tax=Lojkania enalia TaxID=147567 RepID=A0A9P4N0S0_9PLEO|nr:hypothetical protein CC78DRAFT_619976 [Didymosphaeria enalia]